MKIKSVLLSMGLALAMASCGPKDADIQKNIASRVSAFPGVEVTVENGVATVFGVCKDDATKQSIEKVVKEVKGVKSVLNNCEIEAPEPVAPAAVQINADSTLSTAVNNLVKSYSGVNAAVSNGVVTLTGEIKRNQLPALIKSVQELKPKKVENKLTIK